ncbi:MAG: tetratricopeptide repeat-containing diguanylate cyclase [Anaerolineaceae bacterium]
MNVPLSEDPHQALVEKVDALHREAEVYSFQENLDQARILCGKARELILAAEENQDSYPRGMVDNLVIFGATQQFNSSQSLGCFLKALSLLNGMDYPARLVDALNGISWAYFLMGDYASAKAHVEQAVQAAEQLQDVKRLYQSLNTAGVVLSVTGEMGRAVQYLERNVESLKESGNNKNRCVAYNNLAMVLIEAKEYERAEEAGLMGLEVIQSEHLPISESCILDTLGQVYKCKGNLSKSIEYYKRAIDLYRSYEDLDLDFEPFLNLGEVLMLQGDLVEAEKNLLYALDISKHLEVSRLEYSCYEKLAELYELLGDDKRSLMYYRQFHTVKEKIFNQQNIQRIADLISAHKVENALKDAEILRLKNTFLTQEIETEKQRHAELEHLATTDPLTGLFNRRHFQTLGQYEFDHAKDNHSPLTVAILDVDHFKNVNDQHGHAIGDQVLIQLAAMMNATIRREDLGCRYGGDEFVLLLPQLNLENGMSIANRVRTAIEEIQFPIDEQAIHTTISVGVASMQAGDSTLDGLIKRADQALLKAKSAGRNLVIAAN